MSSKGCRRCGGYFGYGREDGFNIPPGHMKCATCGSCFQCNEVHGVFYMPDEEVKAIAEEVKVRYSSGKESESES